MSAAAAAEALLAMRLRLLYSQCALLGAGHSIVSRIENGRLWVCVLCAEFVRLVYYYYYVRVVSTIMMFILWNNDEIIIMNRA